MTGPANSKGPNALADELAAQYHGLSRPADDCAAQQDAVKRLIAYIQSSELQGNAHLLVLVEGVAEAVGLPEPQRPVAMLRDGMCRATNNRDRIILTSAPVARPPFRLGIGS